MLTTGVVFLEPGEEPQKRHRASDYQADYAAIRDALAQRPGVWAVVAEQPRGSTGYATCLRIASGVKFVPMTGPYSGRNPGLIFEACTRTERQEDRVRTYARAVARDEWQEDES